MTTSASTNPRKRPALFRALGNSEPPQALLAGGEPYRLETVYKHDSWAATGVYVAPDGRRIVCKFNRTQSILGLPMRWLGRRLAAREAHFLTRLADVDLVPRLVAPLLAEGRPLPNAVAHDFIPGEPFHSPEQVDDAFFVTLRGVIDELHARDMAYVDLHKRENIIIDPQGRPHLVDFQICFAPGRSWPGNGRLARRLLAILQEMDDYHYRKHVLRCRPQMLTPEERVAYAEPPASIRWHRKVAVPFRTLRRKLLSRLRVRDGAGMATSEVDPEVAVRLSMQAGERNDPPR